MIMQVGDGMRHRVNSRVSSIDNHRSIQVFGYDEISRNKYRTGGKVLDGWQIIRE